MGLGWTKKEVFFLLETIFVAQGRMETLAITSMDNAQLGFKTQTNKD